MKSVHLVIADLFLPGDFAAEVCAGLNLPALENMLARGIPAGCAAQSSLEDALFGLFDVQSGASVAQVSAAFDGLGEGCWLRADPVHVRLQREQVVLLPDVKVSADESSQFCASLNEHFAAEGVAFFAPHPARWYIQVDEMPKVVTVPLSQASGRNIQANLPSGIDAGRWHQLFNEIQMLLFAHPLNETREARGEAAINSVWFWGGGRSPVQPGRAYESVSSDEVLTEMLATAADTPFAAWQPAWCGAEGRQLLVWTGLRSALQHGDLAAWRDALQDFEIRYAKPLWQALHKGQIAQLRLDLLAGDNVRKICLSRKDAWSFWRFAKRLAEYSIESGHR